MRLWYTSSSVGGQYAFMVYQKNKTCAINAYWGTQPTIPQKSISKGPWETHNPHQALMAVQTLASFFPEIAQMSKKSKWLTKVTGFFLVLSFFWQVWWWIITRNQVYEKQTTQVIYNKGPKHALNKVRQFPSSASPKVTTSALSDSNTK